MCAIVGSGGKFRKVPELRCGRFRKVPESSVCWVQEFQKVTESSGACWCMLRRQAPEGSGGFRRVPACAGVGTGVRVRKVPESYGVVCCLATLSGAAM